MGMDQVKADILRGNTKIRFTSEGNYAGNIPKRTDAIPSVAIKSVPILPESEVLSPSDVLTEPTPE